MQCWRRHISTSFFLRRLRKFGGTSPSILRSFYTCTVESILTGCITRLVWNSTAGNRKLCNGSCELLTTLLEVSFPPSRHLHQAVYKESPEEHQWLQPPSHSLLLSAASGRRLRSIRSRTSRLRDGFFPAGYQTNEQSELIHPTAYSHFTVSMNCTLSLTLT